MPINFVREFKFEWYKSNLKPIFRSWRCIKNGAISVTAIATHPVLSGPAIDRLTNSKITKVIVCDTIEVSKDKIFDKLEIMSVANVFGEAMKRIIDGTSLSSMFQEAKG